MKLELEEQATFTQQGFLRLWSRFGIRCFKGSLATIDNFEGWGFLLFMENTTDLRDVQLILLVPTRYCTVLQLNRCWEMTWRSVGGVISWIHEITLPPIPLRGYRKMPHSSMEKAWFEARLWYLTPPPQMPLLCHHPAVKLAGWYDLNKEERAATLFFGKLLGSCVTG